MRFIRLIIQSNAEVQSWYSAHLSCTCLALANLMFFTRHYLYPDLPREKIIPRQYREIIACQSETGKTFYSIQGSRLLSQGNGSKRRVFFLFCPAMIPRRSPTLRFRVGFYHLVAGLISPTALLMKTRSPISSPHRPGSF